jgi:hypothetical protein
VNRQRHSSLWDVVYVLVLATSVVALLLYSGALKLLTDPSSRLEHPIALPRLMISLAVATIGIKLLGRWLRARSRRVR